MKTGRVSRLATKPSGSYKGIRMMADTSLHEELAALIAKEIPAPAKVLDFGAGEGALSQRLIDLGYQVLAVDVEEGRLKASVPFEALDFNDTRKVAAFSRLHDREFDLVLGVEVIEHVENPWQFMRDLTALARPGGYVLVSTPNITSWLSRLLFLRTGRLHQFGDGDRHYGHINPIAQDELRLIAERIGLEVVTMQPGGWLPRLWLTGGLREIAWNSLAFLYSFRMRGIWDGWCLVALLRRPSDG